MLKRSADIPAAYATIHFIVVKNSLHAPVSTWIQVLLPGCHPFMKHKVFYYETFITEPRVSSFCNGIEPATFPSSPFSTILSYSPSLLDSISSPWGLLSKATLYDGTALPFFTTLKANLTTADTFLPFQNIYPTRALNCSYLVFVDPNTSYPCHSHFPA